MSDVKKEEAVASIQSPSEASLPGVKSAVEKKLIRKLDLVLMPGLSTSPSLLHTCNY
jgi:hypothetical protein